MCVTSVHRRGAPRSTSRAEASSAATTGCSGATVMCSSEGGTASSDGAASGNFTVTSFLHGQQTRVLHYLDATAWDWVGSSHFLLQELEGLLKGGELTGHRAAV